MNGGTVFKLYLVALGLFLLIDFIWLGLIARNFYQKHLGHLLSPKPYWPAAIIFYLLFPLGVTYFVLMPRLDGASLEQVILAGLFFGAITYSTYDLSNLATLQNWPVIVTIVDIIWGSSLSASVASLTYFIYQQFFS